MFGMTIKQLAFDPVFLFLAMTFGWFFSLFKQWVDMRRQGAVLRFGQYLAIWPELLMGFGTMVLAYLGMMATDTLNLPAVLAFGYLSNDLVDLLRAQGRSGMVVATIPDGVDMPNQAGKPDLDPTQKRELKQ